MATSSQTGRLLVASPALRDPNFDRTVVLLLEHTVEGAVGLVLNRPSTVEADDALPGWGAVVAPPSVVFVGGPVSADRAIALGRAVHAEAGWRRLFGSIGTVDLTLGPDAYGPPGSIRVFSGYSGWGPGQLDQELEAGGWILADRHDDDALPGAPQDLWGAVVRRQRAGVAMLAAYPRNIRAN